MLTLGSFFSQEMQDGHIAAENGEGRNDDPEGVANGRVAHDAPSFLVINDTVFTDQDVVSEFYKVLNDPSKIGNKGCQGCNDIPGDHS